MVYFPLCIVKKGETIQYWMLFLLFQSLDGETKRHPVERVLKFQQGLNKGFHSFPDIAFE